MGRLPKGTTYKKLQMRYPPSVRMALQRWWKRHPGKWPYMVPEDIDYWLECLSLARERTRGNLLVMEILWYLKVAKRKRTIDKVIESLVGKHAH